MKLGQIVQVLYGREAGNHAIVIGIEGPSFVWLADGKTRPVNKPKKKNIKHVQVTGRVGLNVASAIREGTPTNAELRLDLNQYLGLKDVNE